ncbi:MAG: FAD-dependent oxidoreductase, partial [Lachnospiraceae bacterium]|nr:FAD-dependent oxidoreductase [Lachnospiraceae bacterium]
GQAAGTAAALAVQKGCSVRELPYPALKEALLAQDVILP